MLGWLAPFAARVTPEHMSICGLRGVLCWEDNFLLDRPIRSWQRAATPNVLNLSININSLLPVSGACCTWLFRNPFQRYVSTHIPMSLASFGVAVNLIVWFVDILLLYWCILMKSAAFSLMDCLNLRVGPDLCTRRTWALDPGENPSAILCW